MDKKEYEREKLLPNEEKSAITNKSMDKSEVFIGQEQLIKKVNALIDKAKTTNKSIPHMLFIGEDGMGKETLARIIANQANRKITAISEDSIGQVGDLIGVLTNLAEGDILFINEMDRLSKNIKKCLCPAMKHFECDFVIDKGPYAKNIRFNLKRFTLIGTTTQPDRVDANLMKSFFSIYNFTPYSVSEISKIIAHRGSLANISLDEEALKNIAQKANGNPANLFNKVLSYAELSDIKLITKDIVEECLNTLEGEHSEDEVGTDRTVSEEVRLQVWRRDSGKCVKCGGQERLEYDHIIPVSKGGSNTARNVQLLCEKCNRKKKDNIE